MIDPESISQIGKYQVRRHIAQGGMAWVFEVVDPEFNVPRALKMLKPEAARGEEYQRFLRESGKLAEIDHPNLVTIFDRGQDEATGCFYYVMTYIDGETLSKRIKDTGHLEYRSAGAIFAEVLSALAELHRRGIIHRDIKPANILIGKDGRARLSDLGIAKDTTSDTSSTSTNFAPGTVMYMSPEQARGKPVKPASDVFSIGLSFYFTLTGAHLYGQVDGLDTNSQVDVLSYLVILDKTKSPIPFSFPPELAIPRRIQDVIRKSVRSNEEERYANAGEMLAALRAALEEGEGRKQAAPAATPSKMPPWPVLVGGIAAILLGAIAYWIIVRGDGQGEVEELVAVLEQMRVEVNSAFQRVQELDGGLSPEKKSEVEKLLANGQTFWTFAQQSRESGSWESAKSGLVQARGSYEEACRMISGSGLSKRADDSMAEVDKKRTETDRLFEALGSSGQDDVALKASRDRIRSHMDRFAKAQQEKGACAEALLASDRIEGAKTALSMIEDFSKELGAIGPNMAGIAREEALETRRQAEANSIQAQEYDAELKAGDDLIVQADSLVESDPLRARDSYRDAASRFASAAEVAPAIRARSRAEEVLAEISKSSGAESGKASQLIEEADSLMKERRWSLAAQKYDEAFKSLQDLVDTKDQLKIADERRRDAESARKLAERDNAGRVAADPFKRAEDSFSAGQNAYSSGSFQEAADRFGEAAGMFEDARSTTATAMKSVRDAERAYKQALSRLLRGGGCDVLEAPAARTDCEDGLRRAQGAEQRIAEGSIDSAKSELTAATGSLERAGEVNREYIKNLPQPPKLVRRSPSSGKVEVLRGNPLSLDVEVIDPNENDELTYSWTVDGKPAAGASGRKLGFTPQADSRVAVRVTDSTGNSIESNWTISIKRMPPELTVSPAGNITATAGKPTEFTAAGKSAVPGQVEIEYLLDGVSVGRGPKYSFVKQQPGEFKLVVVARDASGETARVERTIRIENRGPTLAVSPTSQTLELEAGAAQEIKSSASDPDGQAVSIEYLVDGQAEGKGDRFAFQRDQPGNYRLEIVARDPGGQEIRVAKTIRVTPKKKPLSDFEKQVFATLKAYESAVEARDMERLRQVWLFRSSDPMFDLWQARFQTYSAISIDVNIASSAETGKDRATIRFVQSEMLDGRRGKDWEYTVKLLKRTDRWQIVEGVRKIKGG